MYEIIFYEDADGYSSSADYIYTLKKKAATDKSSRINLNKIIAFLDLLQEYGTRIGEPVTKHVNGDIWELRPLKNRILFACYKNNTFILLHYFTKKTKKLPQKELEQALRNLNNFKERNG